MDDEPTPQVAVTQGVPPDELDPDAPDPLEQMVARRRAGTGEAPVSGNQGITQSPSPSSGDASRTAVPSGFPEGTSLAEAFAILSEYRDDNFKYRENFRKRKTELAKLTEQVNSMSGVADELTRVKAELAQAQQQITSLSGERDQVAAARDANAAQVAQYRNAVIKSVIEREAASEARKFISVADALDKVAPERFELDKDGNAPVAAIQAALDAVLTERPHWRAAAEPEPATVTPSVTPGVRTAQPVPVGGMAPNGATQRPAAGVQPAAQLTLVERAAEELKKMQDNPLYQP